MSAAEHPGTLGHYLERECHPVGLGALLLHIAEACKQVAAAVTSSSLSDGLGSAGSRDADGQLQTRLDAASDAVFRQMAEGNEFVAGVSSAVQPAPELTPARASSGRYLLLYDPLDASGNVNVNGCVGSVFSLLGVAETPPSEKDFLQAGHRQVAAGYALYGPATKLVLTVGNGVHVFSLDPRRDAFIETRSGLVLPTETEEFAINASNSRFWEPPVRRYVEECLQGRSGPREKDFNMRWIASLVADVHRILIRGGIYLYPRDNKLPRKAGRFRCLHEANPIAFLVEQAGGRAITGEERVLDVVPTEIHQRTPLIFGSSADVERIGNYHRDTGAEELDTPLFHTRGLFRTMA